MSPDNPIHYRYDPVYQNLPAGPGMARQSGPVRYENIGPGYDTLRSTVPRAMMEPPYPEDPPPPYSVAVNEKP